MQFLQDKNIFERTYFGFVWQMCSFLPSTLPIHDEDNDINTGLLTAKLSSSFLLETFIHAKEKTSMLQWIEMLTKQFNMSTAACEVSRQEHKVHQDCSTLNPLSSAKKRKKPMDFHDDFPDFSGSLTRWLRTTGGCSRSSSSVPTRQCAACSNASSYTSSRISETRTWQNISSPIQHCKN